MGSVPVPMGGCRTRMEGHGLPAPWREAPRRGCGRLRLEIGGAGEIVPLSRRDRAIEVLMMGLRLNDGIDKARFARNAGTPIEQILLPDATSRAEAADLLQNDPGHISLTPKGLRVLDRLLVEIVA